LFTFSAPSEISTLSLHDALPISTNCSLAGSHFRGRLTQRVIFARWQTLIERWPISTSDTGFWRVRMQSSQFCMCQRACHRAALRSEEHTSELQSRGHLVCRLLLE